MKSSVLGIELGKNSFHLYGVDERGQPVLRKKLSRQKLLELMAQQGPCRVGMEACGGAHSLARTRQGYGPEVRLMSPQLGKPYVKSNKTDFLDAEAIGEAVTGPPMRFVPIKTLEQQDLQRLHRARRLVVAQRTAQANPIRGLLLESGLVRPQGIRARRHHLPTLICRSHSPTEARSPSDRREGAGKLRAPLGFEPVA